MRTLIYAWFGIILQIFWLTPPVNADCQGSVTTYTTGTGVLTSPGYPNTYYDNDLSCSWSIILPEGQYPSLVITDVFLSYEELCIYDYLQISADGMVIATICGQPSSLPISITSFTNKIDVLFITDNADVERGFSISWVTATQPGDVPTTPGIPTTTAAPPNNDLYYLFFLLLLLPIGFYIFTRYRENKIEEERAVLRAAARAKAEAEERAKAAANKNNPPPKPKQKKVRTKHPAKSKIAIIYPRGSKNNATKLTAALEAKDFTAVISDFKQGSLMSIDKMAELIKSSECVIVLLTDEFEKDETCAKEIEFADKCHKTIIPVIAEKGFEFGDGWLGLLLGGETCYDIFSAIAKTRETAITKLVSALETAAPGAKVTYTEKMVDC